MRFRPRIPRNKIPREVALRILQLADPYDGLMFPKKILESSCRIWNTILPFEFLTSSPNVPAIPHQTQKKEVVIMGASNVGKSSFLNALFKNKLAFTSKRPGHTKALNFFEGQSRLRLIDVPGYGFGSTTNQMELLGEYITARGSNSAACLLIDARKGIKELDLVAFSLLLDHKLPFQVLDCENILNLELQQRRPKGSHLHIQAISSTLGHGITQSKAAICQLSGIV
eukprot:gene7810-9957_t